MDRFRYELLIMACLLMLYILSGCKHQDKNYHVDYSGHKIVKVVLYEGPASVKIDSTSIPFRLHYADTSQQYGRRPIDVYCTLQNKTNSVKYIACLVGNSYFGTLQFKITDENGNEILPNEVMEHRFIVHSYIRLDAWDSLTVRWKIPDNYNFLPGHTHYIQATYYSDLAIVNDSPYLPHTWLGESKSNRLAYYCGSAPN